MHALGRLWGFASLVALSSLLAPERSSAQAPAANPVAPFEKLDINEDGLLSGTEVKSVSAMDADGDGRVTRAEYDAGVARLAGSAADDEKRFAELDINEDGVLSGKEKANLDKYDADRDGEIAKREYLDARKAERPNDEAYKQALAALEAALRDRAEKVFRAQDGNHDDRLSGTEITPEYKKFDVNGDERITRDEFLAGVLAEQNPSAWPTTTIESLGLSFDMPVKPEFEKDDDGMEIYTVSLEAGKLVYMMTTARMSDAWKNFPEAMFQSAPERATKNGKLLGQERDTIGGNPVLMMTVQEADGAISRQFIMRMETRLVQAYVINGPTVKLADEDWQRFFRSIEVRTKTDGVVPPGERPRIELIPPVINAPPAPPAAPSAVPPPAAPAPPAPPPGERNPFDDSVGPPAKREFVKAPAAEGLAGEAMQAAADYVNLAQARDFDGLMKICNVPWLDDGRLIKDRDELRKHLEKTAADATAKTTQVLEAQLFSKLRDQVNSEDFKVMADEVLGVVGFVVSVGRENTTYSAVFVKFADGKPIVVGWTR